jgi:subfamily B ATP-binding cassette protein HlyB/CyaB
MMNRRDENSGEIHLSWFGKTLWKFAPIYAELVFLAFCLRILSLVHPFIFQVVIDRIIPFQREASLLVVVVVFIAASLFQLGFEILSNLLGMRAANQVTRELGARIFEHLFKLPFRHFRKWHVGEIIARVNETDAIRAFLVGTTTGVFLDLLFVSIYIGILLMLSVQLTWIVLAALPLQLLVYICFGPFLRRRLREQFDAGAAHQTQMVESISGIAAVKALSAEPKMLERLDRTLRALLETGYRVSLLGLWSEKLLFVIDRLVTICIIYFGAQLVFLGQLTLGELVAFLLLAEKVTGPIENFSALWESWQDIRVSRQRLGNIVNLPVEPFGALARLPREIEGRMHFRNVSFSYVPSTPILRNLNFEAEPHTLNLIVGPSGVGKSTFGRLASGIDAPEEGGVYLDGRNIAEYEPRDVRAQIAYVPQEPYLFSGTLRENLTLGDGEANAADIERALHIVGAQSFVAQLPLGLDTEVGERGSALSGGQRQRIAIARSLIRRPKVIILDEPTSALDCDTRRQIAAELQELRKLATVIVITHSPDAFEAPDQVVDFGRL